MNWSNLKETFNKTIGRDGPSGEEEEGFFLNYVKDGVSSVNKIRQCSDLTSQFFWFSFK